MLLEEILERYRTQAHYHLAGASKLVHCDVSASGVGSKSLVLANPYVRSP